MIFHIILVLEFVKIIQQSICFSFYELCFKGIQTFYPNASL